VLGADLVVAEAPADAQLALCTRLVRVLLPAVARSAEQGPPSDDAAFVSGLGVDVLLLTDSRVRSFFFV
jgi:hypothetical protein